MNYLRIIVHLTITLVQDICQIVSYFEEISALWILLDQSIQKGLNMQ